MNKLERNIRKVVINGLCLFTVLGMAACADKNESETENEMGATESSEMTTTASDNYFRDWDANGDGYLDDNEYTGGAFRNWDSNSDSRLDENEWNTASRDFGTEGQGWADWDIDRDGFLNDGEYRTGSNKAMWYRAWDTDKDNRLSEEEYNTGMANRPNRND